MAGIQAAQPPLVRGLTLGTLLCFLALHGASDAAAQSRRPTKAKPAAVAVQKAPARLVARSKARPVPKTALKATVGRGQKATLGRGHVPAAHTRELTFRSQFEAGVLTSRLNLTAAPGNWGRQRMSQWCWAATSQMVLNSLGIPVSQEQIIMRAYGGFIDRPAAMHEIARTLHGSVAADVTGRLRAISALELRQLHPAVIAKDMAEQRPLLLGLSNTNNAGGHAYIITSIKYNTNALGRIEPVSLTLRDPFPGNPSRIEVSWQEANQRFIGAVRIDVH